MKKIYVYRDMYTERDRYMYVCMYISCVSTLFYTPSDILSSELIEI